MLNAARGKYTSVSVYIFLLLVQHDAIVPKLNERFPYEAEAAVTGVLDHGCFHYASHFLDTVFGSWKQRYFTSRRIRALAFEVRDAHEFIDYHTE